MSDGPIARHYERQLAEIAADLEGPEPGRWWFKLDRWSGTVWDRLCPAMHAVAAWSIDLAAPRFATPINRR